MKRFFALALALVLGACAQPVAPEKAAAIKTIGVIVVHSDTIEVQTVGILVFSNANAAAPVPQWRLGAYLTDRVSAALATKYQVKPVRFDRDAFLPEHVAYPNTTSIFASVPSLGQAIREHVSPTDLDAYLIVTESNFALNRGVGIAGDGITHFQSLSGRYVIYALHRFLVVDRQGNVIGDVEAEVPDSNYWTSGIRGPNADVSRDWWAESLDGMSSRQKQQLEGGIKQLIDKSVPYTLGALKLLP